MADTVITITEGYKVTRHGNLIKVQAGATIDIVGADGNEAPDCTTVNASYAEGATASLVGTSSSDPDGTISTYQWVQKPGQTVALTNPTSATATFTTPAAGQELVFFLTITDNSGAKSMDVCKITTLPADSAPPIANAGMSLSNEEFTAMTLDGTASTAGGAAITTYQWVQTSGSPTVSLTNADQSIATFTAPGTSVNLSLEFTLTVTDANTNESSDTTIRTIVPSPSPVITTKIGTNLDFLVDWTSSFPFVDIIKYSRQWITGNSGTWDTGEFTSLDLDANGWPQTIPTSGPDLYRFVRLYWALNSNYTGGTHILTYDGDGTIVYQSGISLTSSTAGRDVVNIVGGGSAIEIRITATNPANHLRNIRLVREADESNLDTFNQDFLDSLSMHKVIRFMNWGRINGNSLTSWGSRPSAMYYTYTQVTGVPLEIMIELCNVLNKDMWLNIPHQADDNHITQAAALVLTNLNSNLNVHIELSNEVFNSQFSQASWIEAKGIALYSAAPDSNFTKRLNWYGKRTAEMVALWKSVWSGSPSRVIAIMGAQADNTYTATEAMNCPLDGGGCGDQIDAIAIAPYFGIAYGSPSNESTVEAMSLTQLFADIDTVAIPQAIGWMTNYKTTADTYSVELMTYEGGQHLVGLGGVENNATIEALFIAANRDSRMNDSYDTYLTGWKTESDNGLFIHYKHINSYSKWGSWGAYEYLGQPITPKQQALEDF